MTSYIRRFFWIVLALSCAIPDTRGGEEEIRRFRDEYPAACARIQNAYAMMSGTIQINKENSDGSKSRYQVSIQKAMDRSLARVEVDDKPGLELVLCTRPEGHYALVRMPGEKKYRVQAIGPIAESMFVRNVGQYLRAPYSFLGEPFDRLVSDPTFRILSAESVSSGDRHGIEVTYAFGEERPDSSSTRVPPHEATFLFDPNRDWIMTQGAIRIADHPPEKAISFSVDYAEATDTIPPVSRVNYVEGGRAAKSDLTDATSGAADPASVVDPASFSMTAFGLPEISTEPQRRANWIPYFLATNALLALVAALWFRRLGRGKGEGKEGQGRKSET